MERSQYNEMIRLLNEDKKALLAQIAEIEKAISSLTNLKNGTGIVRLTDDISSDKADNKDSRKNYYEKVDVEIPLEYSDGLQVIPLFFFALNALGTATVDELKDFVMKLDNTNNEKYLFSRFRDIASGLYRANKIYADTSKKKYKYSLKEQKTKELSFEEKTEREIESILNL